MSESLALVAPGRPLLDYLPVGLFGSVMGLTGLSVAWRLASVRYGVPEGIALGIAGVAAIAFVLLLAGYSVKLVTAFATTRAEFRHPIAGNLFGTVPISLLLLPIVLEPFAHRLAQILWEVGAVGMVLFAWLIVSRWMSDRQQIAHATPAWIVPVVGLLDIPLALPTLGLCLLAPYLINASLRRTILFSFAYFCALGRDRPTIRRDPFADHLPLLAILLLKRRQPVSFVVGAGHVDRLAA